MPLYHAVDSGEAHKSVQTQKNTNLVIDETERGKKLALIMKQLISELNTESDPWRGPLCGCASLNDL